MGEEKYIHDVGSLIHTRDDLKTLLQFVASRVKFLAEEGTGTHDHNIYNPVESPKLDKLYHQLEILAHECD